MTKKTALYEKHLKNGAKLVNFGGWEMPLHYGSQINEHHQVRQAAGMFDVSHMCIVDLNGQRAKEFLRYLLANDVARLTTQGKALYSCMLNENGGVLDDLIVYYLNDTHYRTVVNAATADKDINWIRQQAQQFGIKVTIRKDLGMLAVQGPQARDKLMPLLPLNLQDVAKNLKPFHAGWDEEFFIARTGYTGEEGFEVMLSNEQIEDLWEDLLASGVTPVGLGARDTLRLEAGMNLYGQDMDENYTPLDSGLGWTVAWTPENRQFIGREALQAQRESGESQILVGLVLQEKGVLREHQTVYLEDGGEGQITSGTYSPTLGMAIAFARLPAGVYEQVFVAIRNKRLPALVVKPPFVRHGKACISLPNAKNQS